MINTKRAFVAAVAVLFAIGFSPRLGTASGQHGNHGHHGQQGQGGNNHKPVLHRADCGGLATATDNVGFAIMEFDEDGDLQIEVAVKQGLADTQYRAFVLTAPCNVAFIDSVLSTNGKGKGNIHIMVPASMIPAGSQVAVQLVSPPGAVVPGPGPFTDVITSDFITPPMGDQ